MKIVYGLMTDTGNGNEFLYDLGLWETEEAAAKYLNNEMPNSTGIWVEAIVVNDALPNDLDDDTDEMAICSQCGVEYNKADLTTINDEEVCIYCEPAVRQNMPG